MNTEKIEKKVQKRGRHQVRTDRSDKCFALPEIIHHPSEKVRLALAEYKEKVSERRELVSTGDDLLATLSRYTGLPKKCILTFGDITSAFEAIIKRYARPGGSAVVAGPTGDLFRIAAESCGMNVYFQYGVSPFAADLEGLAEKVADLTDFVYLQNPSHPTGALYNLDELEQLLERMNDSILILDESYIEYCGLTATALLQKFNNLIIVRAFSEAFSLAGLPCCYILSTPARIDEVSVHRPDRAPSIMAEIAATAVLNDFEFLPKRVERINENLIYLSVRLRRLGLSCRMTPADLLLLRVPDTTAVLKALRTVGIFAFDFSYLPQMENYLGLVVTEDTAVNKTAEAFESLPHELYRSSVMCNGKMTLHRSAETVSDIKPEGANEPVSKLLGAD